MSSYKTPNIGEIVLRQVNGTWRRDWCMQIRIDHGKPYPGATKVVGEDLWIESGIIVWGSDLSRHVSGKDVWKEAKMNADEQNNLNSILIECICAFEVFRRLGFPSEEIYIASDSDKIAMILRTQGKEFVYLAGHMSVEPEVLREKWTEMAEKYNAGLVLTDEIFESSRIMRERIPLLVAIYNKGITLPAAVDKLEEMLRNPKAQA